MTTATQQLIALAEQIRPWPNYPDDGMVAQFHDLARRARLEQGQRFPDPFTDVALCPHDQVALAPGGLEYRCGRCGATVSVAALRNAGPGRDSVPLPLDGQ